MNPQTTETEMPKGKYIIVSGLGRSGKSTVLKRLESENVFPGTLFVREPGQTPLAERIRAILLDPTIGQMTPRQEYHFFTAARIDVVRHEVQPARAQGRHVISDRGWPETWAHQWWTGMGRKDLLSFLAEVEKEEFPFPDLWVYFDLDPAVSFARSTKAAAESRIDQQPLDTHQRIREGFLYLFNRPSFPCIRIDASQDKEALYQDVKRQLLPFLKP